MKWIASSILFQSTALAGTLAGVPMPFYGRGLYSRAYAAATCDPSYVNTESASGVNKDNFDDRKESVYSQTISCTISSGTLTTTQYAYSGAYMAVTDLWYGSSSETYRGQTYSPHSNWGWAGFSVNVKNNATITVTETADTSLLFEPGGGMPTSNLRIGKTQSNGLNAVSLGALNWSPHDDNKKTGGGDGAIVSIVSSGDISSSVGGGIFALSQGGTSRDTHDTHGTGGRGGPVSVYSTGTVSGASFGIAALSLGGPATYSNKSNYTDSGYGQAVYVYTSKSVYATKSGPAILAASYGGNTPLNYNSFDAGPGGPGGYSKGDKQHPAASVTVGSATTPMAGKITTQSAGAIYLGAIHQSVQLTRKTGAAIMAISRGGTGVASDHNRIAMDGGSAGEVDVLVYGASSTVMQTQGDQSPGILSVSQGGSSYKHSEDGILAGGGIGDIATAKLSGGGVIVTGGSYSPGLTVQSLGGSGYSNNTIHGGSSDVTVTNDFSITTSGNRSGGIVAQSISAAQGGADYINDKADAVTWGDTGSYGSVSGAVTVTNTGAIKVYGIDSHGIVAQSIGGGGGLLRSTAALSTTSYGNGEVVTNSSYQTIGGQTENASPATVTVTNHGNISTYGGNATKTKAASSTDSSELGGGIGILAQSIGGGGGTNDGVGATGSIGAGESSSSSSSSSSDSKDTDEDGSNGGTIYIYSYATVSTAGSEAHGIVAQSIGGGGGQGRNKKGLFHKVGGAGGPGGNGGLSDVHLEENAAVVTTGDYALGIISQSIGGGGGAGGQATAWGLGFSSATGGSGGSGGHGDEGKILMKSGSSVNTSGDHAAGLLVQSIGGGGGVGGNAKSRTGSIGIGISIAHGGSGGDGGHGGTVKAEVYGSVTTAGTDAQGVVAQSIGGGGGNGGQASSKAFTEGMPIDEDGNTVAVSFAIAHGGTGGKGGSGGNVYSHVYKGGSITTSGDGATGMLVQSIGGGGGNGGDATASSITKTLDAFAENAADDTSDDSDDGPKNFSFNLAVALGGSGGSGNNGGAIYAVNEGAIKTGSGYADGVILQSIGGGGGNAGTGSGTTKSSESTKSAALVVAMGAKGGGGGNGGAVTFGMNDSTASIVTSGHVSRGIFAQSIGGGGGSSSGGGGSGDADWDFVIGLGTIGSSGGVGGDIYAWNGGTITTSGDWSDGILAQSIGGGGGAAGSGKSSLSIKKDESDDDDASDDTSSDSSDDDSDDDHTLNADVVLGALGGSGGYGGSITIGGFDLLASDVVSTGVIKTSGTMSSGIVAQSIGGGGGAVAVSSGNDDSDDSSSSSSSDSSDDKDSGVTLTLGAPGGSGGDGGDVAIYARNVYTAGFAANGVVAQSIAGGGGVGFSSGLAVSKVKVGLGGQSDGNAGTAGTVSVETQKGTSITTKNDAAQGVIAQSIGGGGGLVGVALGTANAVNDDSISDVLSVEMGSGYSEGTAHGGAVYVTHNGTITTDGTRSLGIVAQSISGGGGFVTAAEAVTDKITFVQKQASNSANSASVKLDGSAKIVTSGDGASGILAQTISSGGGVAADLAQKLTAFYGYYDNTSASGTDHYYTGGSDNAHTAGDVTVEVASGASIQTSGKYANGIVAQAIGGAGGIFTQNGKTYAGTLGLFNNTESGFSTIGNPLEGSVEVKVYGSVTVTDPTAWGVWAQTTGDKLEVTVESGGSIVGSTSDGATGGGVYASGAKGTTFTLDNKKYVTGNVVQHTFTEAKSAADGVIRTTSFAGTGVFLNQGTGTFTTGNIADIDTVVNAGAINIGGAENVIRTVVSGDLLGVGSSGSRYDVAKLGLNESFAAFGYYSGNTQKTWRTESTSRGGLLTDLDVDMEGDRADKLVVEGDFAGDWGVDVNGLAFLPNSRTEFLMVTGQDMSELSILSSMVFSFTDPTKSAEGWTGFAIDSADFANTGVGLGRNATRVSKAMQQAWEKIGDGSASEIHFGDDEISLGQAFGAFHQSTPTSFSDDLLTLASQTAAAPLAHSPSAAIDAANSVLSCPAFETTGVMMDEGTCSWGKALGGTIDQDRKGDSSGFTKSTGGFQAGGQKALNDGWFLGGGLTYESSLFKSDSGSEKLDQQSFTGAVALKKEEGPWLFGLVGGAGYNWGDSKRYFNLGQLSATATGSPDSYMLFGRARASYEFAFSDEFYMRPKVDFDVINTHQNGYSETGAGALNLMVDANSQTVFGVTPGLELGARIPFLEDMPARLYADLGVSFLSQSDWETTSRFQGLSSMDSFSTFTPIADTVGHVSVGLDLAKRQGLEVKFQYDGSFADGYQSHTGSLRLGYRF